MATSAKKTASKTTKKTPSKSAKATTATTKVAQKKEVKKTVETSEVTAKVSPVKKPSSNVSTFDRAVSAFKLTGFMMIVFAAFTALMGGEKTREIFWNSQARDLFTGTNSVNLTAASEVLVSVQLRYVLAAILGLGGVLSILIATRLKRRYEAGVGAGVSGLRWLVFGLSSALLIELVSLIAGVQDIFTLKLVGGLMFFSAVFAWFSERENNAAQAPKRLGFYASVLAGVLALMPLAGSLIGTTLFNAERFSWYVYALTAVVVVGFIATLVNHKSSMSKSSKLAYAEYERRFVTIDFVTKALVVIIFISALK